MSQRQMGFFFLGFRLSKKKGFETLAEEEAPALNWNFLTSQISPDDFLIDCRSQSAYEENTLKGAFYFAYSKKAFGSDTESNKKLVGPLQSTLAEAQNSGKSRIVVFDEGMGMFSSRLTYLLRGAGFKETYVFAGKWPIEGTLQPGEQKPEYANADKPKALEGVVDKAFMEKNLTKLQLFDARTLPEYEGRLPRLTQPEEGSLCGRLPGAFLWDWQSLYDTDGNLVDKVTFKKRLNGFPFMPERATVVYDYNGSRSCLLALMLKESGFIEVCTYQGSWFEWRKSSLPKQAVSIFGSKQVAAAAPRVGGLERKSSK